MMYHRAAKWSTYGLIVSSIVLYLAFMLCDIFFECDLLSNTLKYCSILLCFVVTVFRFCKDRQTDSKILMVAFFFTAVADVFLLFTEQFVFGVLSFVIVQLCYLYRIYNMSSRFKSYHVILRVIISGIILLGIYFSPMELDFLLGVTVFYFINFAGNLLLLANLCKKRNVVRDGENVILPQFLIGMILFFLCDISVGIYNMSAYLPMNGFGFVVIKVIAFYGMWGFYLPGQVCIALSTKTE